MAIPIAVAGLGLVVIILAAAAVLLAMGRMSGRAALGLLAIAVIGPGLALGGLPDPIAAVPQIPYGFVRGTLNPVLLAGIAVLLLTGLLAGRLYCGYGCPLGAVQELLARLTRKKLKVDARIARRVRLAALVAFMAAGAYVAFFPGIDPMAVFALRPNLCQLALFAGIGVAATFVYRPWCNMLCPFGALADLAATVSPYRLRADAQCNDCGACDRICPAGQSVRKGTLTNCYYCGRCIRKCPKGAIYAGLCDRPAAGEKRPEQQPLNKIV